MIKYFNEDYYVAEKILSLKQKWDIKTVIETGTYQGDSTKWFGENFEKIYTVEVNPDFQKVAIKECESLNNIEFLLGDTTKIFPSLLSKIEERVLFYLDAHGFGRPCPTPQEMEFIASRIGEEKFFPDPIIIIHDFKNPNYPEYSYNTFFNFAYRWDLVEPFIRNIYRNKFIYYFNEEAAGAKVGLLYVEPLN